MQILCPSVAFGSSVSMMKQQKTMLSFLSSSKRSRRVAGKLYNNFRGKQNKAYVLVMKKHPIARNTRFVVDRSTFALPTVWRTLGDKATLDFTVKFYLKCIPDNDLKEALKIILFNSVKVLDLRRK